MRQLEELEETFLEEYEAAQLLLQSGKYKATTILLSKSLFALVDCILFQRYQLLPKNHRERFQKLEVREVALYKIVDRVWDTYTDTYSKPTAEASIQLLRDAILEIIKKNEDLNEKITALLTKKEGNH